MYYKRLQGSLISLRKLEEQYKILSSLYVILVCIPHQRVDVLEQCNPGLACRCFPCLSRDCF